MAASYVGIRQRGVASERKVSLAKFSANAEPVGFSRALSLFSCFCADKSQDVPREEDRKAKA